jgi:plastocyanin
VNGALTTAASRILRRMSGGGCKRLMPLMIAAAAMLGATGCELADQGDNLVAGKTAFVQRCGSCHTLARAGTTGVTGPDLDAAFRRARQDGLGESTFKGQIHRQIEIPARRPQMDPQTGKELPLMPANLVEGERAEDVAAYVASAVAKPGKDRGRLADIGVKRSTAVARERNGQVDIPADPSGALAYRFASAEAQPGELLVESRNAAQIPHNIAIEGGGVNEQGPVVQGGGVSRVTFNARPGEYTFYCSVPGHRQGGMVGKLVVK